MINATIIYVHQHGAGANDKPSSGVGRSQGGINDQIQADVDVLGNPLRFVLLGGLCHNSVAATRCLAK
ncbi:hypothetical protein ACPV3A_30070 [Paenibacillus sp. Dod16]|uniref:hypothetical protein n=1 Tax=unclassified Paenibacillus TaxID=185978 RepID=UPI0035C0ED01